MRVLLVATLLGLTVAPAAEAEPRWVSVERFEMRSSETGASRPVTLWEIPAGSGEIRLTATVEITPELRRPGQPLGLYFAALASHEVWWDGTLLGRGGVVGGRAEDEVPGPVEAHYQIPDAVAAPGPHRLEIRASSFHRGFLPSVGYWAVVIGDYEDIVTGRRREAWTSAMALSGLVLTAGFAFALFGALRDRASLLLGLLAATAAALLGAEVWRPLVGYTYDRHLLRLLAIVILAWLLGVQLVGWVVLRFPRPGGRRWLAGVAVVTALAPWFVAGWDGKALVIYAVSFSAALLWVLGALTRRQAGSTLALVGVATAFGIFLLDPSRFPDRLFVALNLLFLCLLVAHAREMRRVRQAKIAAEHEATRLELEMVRRQIQPHFLMNSLTALAEWVESDPATAVRMIEAMGEELRLLGELSQHSLIPAAEELKLCRSHLETMGLRKDVRYELTVEGLRGDEPIPPAVLHTLVENAVTHGSTDLAGAAVPHVQLTLRATLEAGRRHLVFESPAPSGETGPIGTGSRYIEARLRQAWGEDWSFRQGAVAGRWRAELTIPAGAAR